jgi:hypothetical protein
MIYTVRSRLKGSQILITEDLTKCRQSIMVELLRLRKDEMIHGVWTTDGRIYYRKTEKSCPVNVDTTMSIKDIEQQLRNG